MGDTTWFDAAMAIFPSETIIAYGDFVDTVLALENGDCNVIGGSLVDIELIAIRAHGIHRK